MTFVSDNRNRYNRELTRNLNNNNTWIETVSDTSVWPNSVRESWMLHYKRMNRVLQLTFLSTNSSSLRVKSCLPFSLCQHECIWECICWISEWNSETAAMSQFMIKFAGALTSKPGIIDFTMQGRKRNWQKELCRKTLSAVQNALVSVQNDRKRFSISRLTIVSVK